jgi:hypothetical protein
MRLPERWKRDRTASLKALGMADYGDYLASPLWAVIRRRVYGRAKGVCEAAGCDKQPTAVHHWSYALPVMRGATLKALQALCKNCHDRAHGKRKSSPKAAVKRANKREWKAWVAAGGACGQKTTAAPRLVKRAPA